MAGRPVIGMSAIELRGADSGLALRLRTLRAGLARCTNLVPRCVAYRLGDRGTIWCRSDPDAVSSALLEPLGLTAPLFARIPACPYPFWVIDGHKAAPHTATVVAYGSG